MIEIELYDKRTHRTFSMKTTDYEKVRSMLVRNAYSHRLIVTFLTATEPDEYEELTYWASRA